MTAHIVGSHCRSPVQDGLSWTNEYHCLESIPFFFKLCFTTSLNLSLGLPWPLISSDSWEYRIDLGIRSCIILGMFALNYIIYFYLII